MASERGFLSRNVTLRADFSGHPQGKSAQVIGVC